jgi:daunorubicin/doxorubicin transport system permease protein
MTEQLEAQVAEVNDTDLRKALTVRQRPPRPSAVSASLTFGWRALMKIKHVPEQLFDVTAFPVMMTLIFTFLLGGALAGSPTEYLAFVLPGILVQSVVMITMYTGMSLKTDIDKGIFDRIRTLPIWQPAPLVGGLLADGVRYTLASIVTITLGVVLGFRPGGGFVGVVLGVALLLVFAFSLSWLWTFIALLVRTPQSVMSVSMAILFPLTFISNIFVDPSTMPGWLQALVEVNPITLLVTAVRGLMHGVVTADQLGWVLLSCGVLIAVFGMLTMRRYRRT